MPDDGRLPGEREVPEAGTWGIGSKGVRRPEGIGRGPLFSPCSVGVRGGGDGASHGQDGADANDDAAGFRELVADALWAGVSVWAFAGGDGGRYSSRIFAAGGRSADGHRCYWRVGGPLWVAVSLGSWQIPDTADCLAAGFGRNTVLNTFFALVFAAPLAPLYRHVREEG